MNLSKTQLIYILSSIVFAALIIFVPYLKNLLKSNANGSEDAPKLANMKEIGKTRILEGVFQNATFTLKLKYKDARRHSIFENALSEQLGFDAQNYHVFILEVALSNGLLQTKPDSDSSKITKQMEKLDLPLIKLRLLPQNVRNIDLSVLKLEKTTNQGKFYLRLHTSPISLASNQKTFRYVFFRKDFNFNDIDTAELKLSNAETVILNAVEIKYAIPPTIPNSFD